jgi:phosphatidylethanolamine-binding protein (PEBP) family uncharacterized protein
MLFSKLTTLTALLSCSLAAPAQSEHQIVILPHDVAGKTSLAIRDILKDNEIITQVLDDFEPSFSIEVTYPDHHHQVLLGNDISVEYLQQRPVFTFRSLSDAQPGDSIYTLILTDPDATSREKPKKSEMCHWIVTNLTTPIQDSDIAGVTPAELEEYYAPAPPPKTGPHRYVFVLLEGTSAKLKAPKERPHWGYGKQRHGVRDWAKENDLKVVGANFFFAQNKKQ